MIRRAFFFYLNNFQLIKAKMAKKKRTKQMKDNRKER